MTEVREESAAAQEGAGILFRAVQSQELDGRTLHVRVVPFGEVATVADPPDFMPYQEEFVSGVFRAQEKAAHRITLRTDHASIDNRNGQRLPGVAGVVGRGVSLRESNGGVEGEFRFLETNEAETARELVREGVYDGVSAEFMLMPGGTTRTKNGVMRRTNARLKAVALAVEPAYTGAEILALRAGVANVVIDEELMPPAANRELLERCKKLGVPLPEGMATLLDPNEEDEEEGDNSQS